MDISDNRMLHCPAAAQHDKSYFDCPQRICARARRAFWKVGPFSMTARHEGFVSCMDVMDWTGYAHC